MTTSSEMITGTSNPKIHSKFFSLNQTVKSKTPASLRFHHSSTKDVAVSTIRFSMSSKLSPFRKLISYFYFHFQKQTRPVPLRPYALQPKPTRSKSKVKEDDHLPPPNAPLPPTPNFLSVPTFPSAEGPRKLSTARRLSLMVRKVFLIVPI